MQKIQDVTIKNSYSKAITLNRLKSVAFSGKNHLGRRKTEIIGNR